ncbi:general transcription factor IIF subunit 1-like [Acyrthosiphon pisum]|uniref:Transcription initiation factor IIF subunit alpha n=1 Tax=Acyrthosiphon pisum TaxID=7029 RepID=A0A8R2H4Q3_ACYPI|nr:general transcription factor IIF subunit 1-like [Acyrthosiphon pisum]
MQNNQAGGSREFTLKIKKNSDVKYQLLKFNKNNEVEKWSSHTKLKKEVKGDRKTPVIDDMPKFGAGSEFGREARLKAKNKKYNSNKNLSETTSWNLDIEGKKFKGARQGGIDENCSYYIFSREEGNVINAHKLEEWYNFQPVLRYKTLTTSEAEEEFERRDNAYNKFNIMIQKKLSNEEDEEIDEYNENKEKNRDKSCKTKEFKISEMDEWDGSNEDSSNSTEEKDNEKIKTKHKQKRKVKTKPKNKSKGSDKSAAEDSDNGDEDGRELDYISDSSEDVSDVEAKVTKELKGVSEEKALKSLLASDEDTEAKDDESKTTDINVKNNTDSENSDMDSVPINIIPVNLDGMKTNSNDPICIPNISSNQSLEPPQKKVKEELSPVTMFDTHDITEEAVRRYLLRKPFTSAQLINKFKNRSNLSSEQLVKAIGLILKKINPEKQIIQNKMYLILNN